MVVSIDKRERSVENRVSASRILHRAIITVTQELLLLSVRLQSCSFYNKLLFDRTDLPPTKLIPKRKPFANFLARREGNIGGSVVCYVGRSNLGELKPQFILFTRCETLVALLYVMWGARTLGSSNRGYPNRNSFYSRSFLTF